MLKIETGMRTGEKSAHKSNILCGILLYLYVGLLTHTPNTLHHLNHQSAATSKCLVIKLL